MAEVTANVRMYRLLELGDCFLISFSTGSARSRMLIDCGSFKNSEKSIARLQQIVAQIKDDVDGSPIDVAVGTHQHNDHLSGFLHCTDEFKEIGIGQVWLSWLDDPKDKLAREIGKDYNNLRVRLGLAMQKMRAHPAALRAGSRAARSLEIVGDMMGFFGADEKTPPEAPMLATKALKTLGAEKPRYLEPADVVEMPGLPEGSVRIHVLGPPRDDESLFRKDPRKGESYHHRLAASSRMATAIFRALDRRGSESQAGEEQYPFAGHHKRSAGKGSKELRAVQKRYKEQDNSWRTVDDDWLEHAGGLALWLDGYTNNSSLVLAIELVESGKVLLFAADAQTGNWSSWKDIEWKAGHPGTADLLQRTVLYKVGHHASHNATLRDVFEQMGGDDLCALIPVHKQDPNIKKKTNGWKMPAKGLFKRLVEKTEGRVLQMDGVNPPESNPQQPKVKAAWARAGVSQQTKDNYIELVIK